MQLTPKSEREAGRLLLSMPLTPNDVDAYVVNAHRVAEALLAKIDEMADERARFRRSLIYSVEMIETPDFDPGSISVE